MGVLYSPKIVTDGLVLALDAANGKSFRGEPTENKINPNGFSSDSNFTVEKLAEYTFKVTLNSMPGSNGYYIGQSHTSLANTSTTMSVEVLETSNPSWVVGISGWGHITIGDSYIDGLRYVRTITHTVNWSYSISLGYVNSFFRSNINVGDYIIARFAQIEEKPYATPFVNGTRGTTVATGGGWADRSGNSNHGELVNGPTFDSDNLGSLVFDGIDDYVFTTGINTSEYMSMSCWFKTSVQQTNKYLVAMGLNLTGNNGFDLTFQNAQIGSFIAVSGSNSGSVLYTTNYYDNNWHYIITTYDGSVARFYYDGVEVATRTGMSGGITIEATKRLNIGSWVNNGVNSNVSIAFVSLYNRALAASEVLQNYNATKGRFNL